MSVLPVAAGKKLGTAEIFLLLFISILRSIT